MTQVPNSVGSNGKDEKGRFTKGNPGGPGNPEGRRFAKFRHLLMETVGKDNFREIVLKLVDLAKEGDTAAAKLLLERCCGPTASFVVGDANGNFPIAVIELPSRSAAVDTIEVEAREPSNGNGNGKH